MNKLSLLLTISISLVWFSITSWKFMEESWNSIKAPITPLSHEKEEIRNKLDEFFYDTAVENLAIVNVSVIDLISNTPRDGMDVLISNRHIESIIPTGSKIKKNYKIINGKNKYLIPGLSDMHVHIMDGANLSSDLFLFLAKGVTTIRIMWGSSAEISMRDSINSDLKIGPRLFVASPGFDGHNSSWPGAVNTFSTQQIRDSVDYYKANGYDFIKVYSNIPKDQYLELVKYAQNKGIRVVGHTPDSMDPFDVIGSGQYSIEHFNRYISSRYSQQKILNKTVQSAIYNCPTLTVLSRTKKNIPSYITQWYDYISPEGREFLKKTESHIPISDTNYLGKLELLNKLYKLNGKIIAGTDTGIRYVIPGEGLHEELSHYVKAGMTNFDALKTATSNAGDFLNNNKIGRIEIGAYADLVLLDNDPLKDIKNTESIYGVINRGQWISNSSINKILGLIKKSYTNP